MKQELLFHLKNLSDYLWLQNDLQIKADFPTFSVTTTSLTKDLINILARTSIANDF